MSISQYVNISYVNISILYNITLLTKKKHHMIVIVLSQVAHKTYGHFDMLLFHGSMMVQYGREYLRNIPHFP